MKIVFVYPTFENLGIEYLSAVLKEEGHQTELIFDPCLFDDTIYYQSFLKNIISDKNYIIDRVIKSHADLICFSVVSDRYFWACQIAKGVREKTKVPIIFGGIHPTAMPEEVLRNDFVDYVAVGEGEGAIVELAKRLEEKDSDYQIKNVWLKRKGQIISNEARDLIQDLDSLPFPDKDLYSKEYTDFKGQYTIITSRGCPFSCTYCNNNFLKKFYKGKGEYYRFRSIDNVIAELKLAKEKHKVNSVYFFDEELFFEAERAKKLLYRYRKEINLPFWCYVNPRLMDEEKVNILKSSGCYGVEMGVQDLDPVLNRNILGRNIDLEHLKKIIKKIKKTKITIFVDIMLGIPTQKEQNLINMAIFFNENRIDFPLLFWTSYYPKTDIIDIAIKEGIVQKKEIDKLNYSSVFHVKGYTYNIRFAQIANIFYLCCLLPKWIVRLIIKKRFYEFFPSILLRFIFIRFIKARLFILKLMGIKKKNFYFKNRKFFYLHYFWRWLKTR